MDWLTIGITIFIVGILYRLAINMRWAYLRHHRCLSEGNRDRLRRKFRSLRYLGFAIQLIGIIFICRDLFS